MVLRNLKRKNPDLVFGLCGCMAQQEKAIVERENKSMTVAVNKIDQMFKMYSENGSKSTKDISHFIQFIKKQAEKTQIKSIYNLSENAFAQLMLLLNSQLEHTQNTYLENKFTEQKLLKRINEIDNYLSVDIDEKAIARIYKRICELQTQRTEIEVLIDVSLNLSSFNKYLVS